MDWQLDAEQSYNSEDSIIIQQITRGVRERVVWMHSSWLLNSVLCYFWHSSEDSVDSIVALLPVINSARHSHSPNVTHPQFLQFVSFPLINSSNSRFVSQGAIQIQSQPDLEADRIFEQGAARFILSASAPITKGQEVRSIIPLTPSPWASPHFPLFHF